MFLLDEGTRMEIELLDWLTSRKTLVIKSVIEYKEIDFRLCEFGLG